MYLIGTSKVGSDIVGFIRVVNATLDQGLV